MGKFRATSGHSQGIHWCPAESKYTVVNPVSKWAKGYRGGGAHCGRYNADSGNWHKTRVDATRLQDYSPPVGIATQQTRLRRRDRVAKDGRI